MIFQPVIHPLLVALICAPVAVVAVIALVRSRRAGKRMLWALRVVLVLACAVLLLRPGLPGGSAHTLATDTDVVLMVDTTASIVAEDWEGDEPRLAGVREDVAEIVAAYPGARFALITFDAAAQLRVPLTTDTTSLMSSLTVLRPEVTARSQGSSIGIGARMLQETLAKAASSAPDRSRMVFYLGDGEQTTGSDPESFAGAAEYVDAGAVLGYGTAEGGPMRITTLVEDGQEYIEYQGAPARSVIDEANLQTVAEQLRVGYQHRSADAAPELPEAPTTTTDYSASGEVGNVIELYWIAAVLIMLLLAAEAVRATALLTRTRGLTSSRPTSREPAHRTTSRPLSEPAHSATSRPLSEHARRASESKRPEPTR